MTWSWEYNPSEEYLTEGAPEAFIAEVEAKADELVRAAHALHLDGTTYQGAGEPMKTAIVPSGFFLYTVVPRSERVYILRLHAL
ncbi:hypothetical protein [Streptacidiphilus anmyonensis]|uniref:hypothetical protein n=1 Tax=Streptacidiphilus anmyonensis TaxID=405782 RepID=UPI0005AA14AF|nr:hypothetical protein [Streptacidiphilus anmyonensis]